MKQSNEKKVCLYGRLSKEDEKLGDSYSIVNQRSMLLQYAMEQGFANYEFVYDDDYTGANIDRPVFQKMFADIRAGLVSTVIVKDLSRFARDRLDVGNIIEREFPKYDVRFISVYENIDTINGVNELLAFISLFNEHFLRSTSQKIRAVWQHHTTKEKGNFFKNSFCNNDCGYFC